MLFSPVILTSGPGNFLASRDSRHLQFLTLFFLTRFVMTFLKDVYHQFMPKVWRSLVSVLMVLEFWNIRLWLSIKFRLLSIKLYTKVS